MLEYPIVKEVMKLGKEEYPTVINCFFIKNSKLWYFVGTNKGRIMGFPVLLSPMKHVIVENQCNEFVSPIAYFNFV